MRRAATVSEALGQSHPLRSPGQEGVLALLLAAEAVRHPYEALFAAQGDLTFTQYNCLRILRGAGRDGLCTSAIAERMISRTPGMSRMIDRLEAKSLVARHRNPGDRREVHVVITAAGLSLLERLDPEVDRLDRAALACLPAEDLALLTDLLTRIRLAQPG